ncbi:type II secretion system protein N [Glaciecola sp. 1036]|uniref:type II secretion system protein N n=1 Tax=Alteromonadaceae TaxID=72275 RepID=UPI003D070765
MKTWQWILFSIIVYVVFLVAYAPASLIQLAAKDNPNLAIVTPTGTLFNGVAERVIVNGISIEKVEWTLSALPLLWLDAQVNVNAGNVRNTDQIYIKGLIQTSLLNPKYLHAEDFQAYLPIKQILAQRQLPVVITADGRIRINLTEFTQEDGCISLSGTGSWPNASVTANNKLIELGDFEAQLSCQQNNYLLTIAGDNEIKLNAQISISASGAITPTGTFTIDPSLPPEIKQAAPYFGRETQRGEYKIFEKTW